MRYLLFGYMVDDTYGGAYDLIGGYADVESAKAAFAAGPWGRVAYGSGHIFDNVTQELEFIWQYSWELHPKPSGSWIPRKRGKP